MLHLLRMSSFHQRFGLAQMVIFQTYLSSSSTIVDWIQPISSSRDSRVVPSPRTGLSDVLRFHTISSLGSVAGQTFYFSSSRRSLRAHPRISQLGFTGLGGSSISTRSRHDLALWPALDHRAPSSSGRRERHPELAG